MSYINKNGTRTVRIGTQDTGYYRSDNSNDNWTNWSRFGPFGEGMIFTDPNDPNIVYRINAGGHGGNIQKSIDGGNKFKNTKVKAGNYVSVPFEIDKTNTNNLIFDNYKNYDRYTLSLSNDQMTSAVDISNGIENLDMGMNLALALSKKNPAVFYVARKSFHLEKYGINNSLYKSENFDFNNPDKITYKNLTENIHKADSTITQNAFITDIELNDSNENELWISFGNLETGKKVFHSTDGGENWKNISKNLPNVPINVLKFDADNKQLYVGNDYGVYHFNEISNQWSRFGNDLPVVMITSIEIDSIANEMIASTHGRSVWTTPLQKKNDLIISSDTVWTTDRNIKGDLIIKEGVSLLLSNVTLKTNNILLENNATLNSFSSAIISNYENSYGNHFNTNLVLKPRANFNISNTKINNFTINSNANSTITLYGTNDIILNQSEIRILKSAKYHQHKNTKLILSDKDSNVLFFEDIKLGADPNCTKIEDINFSGNGHIKTQNSLIK